MLLTTSTFQEFWLGKSSTQMEEFWRLDSCVSFQKNLHTEALCKLFTLKGVFSFIQKSEVKFTLTQPGTRKGQWPSRNFHKQSFPPRRPLRKKKKRTMLWTSTTRGLDLNYTQERSKYSPSPIFRFSGKVSFPTRWLATDYSYCSLLVYQIYIPVM